MVLTCVRRLAAPHLNVVAKRVFLTVCLAGLLAAGCGTKSRDALVGKYLLTAHEAGTSRADTIDFQPGGVCVLVIDGRANITGTYQIGWGKRLIIHADSPSKDYSFKFRLLQYTL